MINRNELRFGNWALGTVRPDEPMQIQSIDRNICKLGEYIEDYNGICPIPLEPDLLVRVLKFAVNPGADPLYVSYRLTQGNVQWAFYVADGFMRYQTVGSGWTINFGHKVKTLHQFQNVYFDVMGEEYNIPFTGEQIGKRILRGYVRTNSGIQLR